MDAKEYRELQERIRMLNDIALSAVALKLNIENGFAPSLHALNRDLGAYQRRFGGITIYDEQGNEVVGKGNA